jgi:tRNA A37 methylthiotransferase MiaB
VKGKAEVGGFSNVKIQEANEYELIGEIIKS